ncbi:hypothetical protein DRI50_07260 [candidate division KSB1 bacterium]|nr:MAG: hypothetical protein DRI50_07260 [candidate division KSB1 bacterium]
MQGELQERLPYFLYQSNNVTSKGRNGIFCLNRALIFRPAVRSKQKKLRIFKFLLSLLKFYM